MKELLDMLQTVSFFGILAGAFTMSPQSRLRYLSEVSLCLCVGCFLLKTYWNEVVASLTTLFTWIGLGAVGLAVLYVGFKLAKRFLLGRHV